ncbi:TPA: site-specific DNA-methyltransferase [Corynebacterium striatum]|nr:site-specific DNA-methyltransferase [Corynebacterium striatum]HAT1276011.1 site-specific DNA-methyltransferase [Corynebacterium striatum]HAT1290802.1 site-specific DNA-methyltransferase [Corynebacterium striatum]HAT1311526.1 site-specific DNA-methyltransferase [Corynebacterium striatum]HAT1320547.1 site-specific DNA-methyltransferase [Corynebacterium striatum]
MKFLQELEAVLKSDERFVSQDGQLLKPRVRDAVSQLDAKLIHSLVASPLLKEHFFENVDGITIFDQEKFMWVVSSKEFLPDSYTAYRNKIGLSANDHVLISASSEVTLVWPYKDCVLEGGQDKEDEHRDEIFYNETLAPDEVTRLLAPKAFCNATRYTAEGKERLTEFDENENLLIKGNNLLALSSLLERYEGQVKCIYIDPPYNTGGDSFNYNDSFNHSSWLTFMRNRLGFARKLLCQDGVIYVHCDDNEQAYLKVLMDQVFGRENFIASAPRKTGAGAAANRANYVLRRPYDFILIYGKEKLQVQFTKINKGTKSYPHKDEYGSYSLGSLQATGSDAYRENRPNLYYPIYADAAGVLSLERRGDSVQTILPDQVNGRDGRWMWKREKFLEDKDRYLIFDGGKIRRKIYLDPSKDQTVLQNDKAFFDESIYRNAVGTTDLNDLLGRGVFSNPKPEALIAKLLDLATKPGDLVLDFFLGSGTTAAVAHKMGRRYIGVEQMDYISSVTIPRLQKVIEGEQGGVSQAQEWKGGGSFVYFELAEQGEQLMSELQDATTTDEVQAVLDQATERGLLRPSVLPDEIAASASNFAELSFDDQKMTVAELVDKNRLYVNASEVEDADLGLEKADVEFTKSFYQKGE